MSQPVVDSKPMEDKWKELEARISKSEGEIKGAKGQIGLIRKQVGLGKPGKLTPQLVESLREPASLEKEPDSSPKEAEESHWYRPYEKYCSKCGGPNPDYTKPNIFCKDCGHPMGDTGHHPIVEKDGKKDIPTIGACTDCGSRKAEIKDE